jgi:glutaredoxin 3
MKFTVYAKTGCPYCVKIQKVLELSNVNHEILYLNDDFDAENFIKKFGSDSSFPQVTLDNERHIGGCIDTVKFLKECNVIN